MEKILDAYTHHEGHEDLEGVKTKSQSFLRGARYGLFTTNEIKVYYYALSQVVDV